MSNFKNVFGNVVAQFKSQFIPTKDPDLRMTWGGAIAVPDSKNPGSYLVVDKDGVLRRYPAAMTINLPVLFISRTVDKLQKGDVIKHNGSYLSIVKIKDGKIITNSYTGYTRSIIAIEDVITGNSVIPVAINLFGAFGDGSTNPMTSSNGLFGGLFGNQQGGNNMFSMLMMSKLFGGSFDLFGSDDSDDDDSPVNDKFSSMDRHELKLYKQKNHPDIKVFGSTTDEALRNEIRKREGLKTSESVFGGGGFDKLFMLSQLCGNGSNPFGGQMSPIAMMALAGNGDNSDDLVLMLMMNQMGMLKSQAPAPADPVAAPEVVATAPVENAD